VEYAFQTLGLPSDGGGPAETEPLFAALYAELHRMARRLVSRGARDLTLGATTLLHETYLDMAGRDSVFADRGQFMAYASRVMRTRIVDHLRRRQTHKRGGAFEIRPLESEVADPAAPSALRARMGQAMEALAASEPLLARVVDLRFFGGFTYGEIAGMLGLSERTVQRLWGQARLHLRHAIAGPAAVRP
jgi:RNA polymerase sigma factor (TIGR02999 family)